ncbi:M20/M25/M40 family metallo-hydrolase [Geodermatophilus sp. SYSU D00779]
MTSVASGTVVPSELRDELHALYRHLHAAPELSMQEHRTAALITERMSALGFETSSCGGTGVVAVLRNGDGPVVGLRADTDALPVAEDTGLDYASTARGRLRDGTEVPVMHACGHDTHITCAIGAASLLAGSRDTWSGTVVVLFQPGEETSEGASARVADRRPVQHETSSSGWALECSASRRGGPRPGGGARAAARTGCVRTVPVSPRPGSPRTRRSTVAGCAPGAAVQVRPR